MECVQTRCRPDVDQMYCCKQCRVSYYRKSGYMVLFLSKKVFDAVLSGSVTVLDWKHTEYWENRFKRYFGWSYGPCDSYPSVFEWHFPNGRHPVVFRCGTKKESPQFTADVSVSERTNSCGILVYALHVRHLYGRSHCANGC